MDPLSPSLMYVLDVALILSKESVKNLSTIDHLVPPASNEKGVVEVCEFVIKVWFGHKNLISYHSWLASSTYFLAFDSSTANLLL